MQYRISLDENLAAVRHLAESLLGCPPIPLHDKTSIPVTGGVYLFHEQMPGDITDKIYVGIAKNLRRRIHTDHLSAEIKDTMSTLRRSLNQARKLEFGKAMQNWLKTNCSVSFIEVSDPDMRKLVETLVVVCLRSPSLLNKL